MRRERRMARAVLADTVVERTSRRTAHVPLWPSPRGEGGEAGEGLPANAGWPPNGGRTTAPAV